MDSPLVELKNTYLLHGHFLKIKVFHHLTLQRYSSYSSKYRTFRLNLPQEIYILLNLNSLISFLDGRIEADLDWGCHPRYIGHDLDPTISRALRSVCLTVILLMAGLELDPVALMKLSAMVVRATFIPCFVEAVAVAVLSNLILGFPWTVGFMLGFVLAAVSPAVIIPSLMSLSQRG